METVIEKSDVKEIVEYISTWEKIEDPKLADICSLLRSLDTSDLCSWMLGLCRVNRASTELLMRSVQISSDCVMREKGQGNNTVEDDCGMDETPAETDDIEFYGKNGPISCEPECCDCITELEGGSVISRLTDREKEVLRWLGKGKSNWEIGRILGISERTAKYHTSNILSKLELNNRVQAAVFAALLSAEKHNE